MGDTTIIKVDSTHSPHGLLGQTYLATGVGVGMRLWRDQPPGEPKPETARDYETVGYVISGRAELHSEGQMVLLEPGDSWVVPRHARHTYKILEPFTAVEATHRQPRSTTGTTRLADDMTRTAACCFAT